jgi:HD-GYP domain-containing protein (c-di-GMP phosphodiesterase class II)
MAKKSNIYKLPVRGEFSSEKSNTTETNSENTNNVFPINREFFEITIKTLLNALRCKDDYTWGHSLRVAYFCVSVGKEMGFSPEEIYELEVSALFHDIGKIGVPDAVLLKPSRLTEEEFLEMKLHPSKSYQILQDFPVFHKMAVNAKHHHERFDGRGYPDGLKGEAIPLFARIILIADTFDAMTSTRPYRKGLPFETAFAELREFAGSQFDANIVEHFISAMTKEQKKNEETFTLQVVNGDFKKDAA